MKADHIDTLDDIDADQKNPNGSVVWIISEIEEEEDLDDVVEFCISKSAPSLTYPVPNAEGCVPAMLVGRIHRLSIKPDWLDGSHNTAICLVRYGVRDSVSHVTAGGESPVKNEEDGGPAGDELIGPEWSFEIRGGTRHITQLDETLIGGRKRMERRYARMLDDLGVETIDAPNYNGAIGVSDKGIEGVELRTGVSEESVTVNNVPITKNFIRYLRSMVFTLNMTKSRDDEPEERLFTGASIRVPSSGLGTVTYTFEVGKNVETVTIAGVEIPEVKAHDYVWCRFHKVTEDGITQEVPKEVFVDRLYELAEHAGLFEPVP